jgi:uncharacterized membrane protein YbhN (UPF0104 family)
MPTVSAPVADRRTVVRRLLTVVLLAVAGATVVLAVPDLRPVAHQVETMDPALVAAAVALELASCLGFVAIFGVFFPGLTKPTARNMAWAQMGSGALLPGGGAGSMAIGGWLLHQAGMPTREIVRRSSGLFFLTSAINVLVLALAGSVLLLGVGPGPHDVLRAGLPVLAAAAVTVLVLGVPRLTRQVSAEHPRLAWLDEIGVGIPAARRALARPSWGLLGAGGYLLFDIAVLWTTFAAAGLRPPIAPLVVAYLVGYLANATPIPGGIGVLDAGLVGALALYHLPVTQAAAAVLVYHAVAFWLPTVGGTLAYARLRPRLHTSDPASSGRLQAAEADLDVGPQLLVGLRRHAPGRESGHHVALGSHPLDLGGGGDHGLEQQPRSRGPQPLHDLVVQALAPVDHGEEPDQLRAPVDHLLEPVERPRRQVAGTLGTSSASAASNTFSDTSEMLGGQSRKTRSYSVCNDSITRRRRRVGFLNPSRARSMCR